MSYRSIKQVLGETSLERKCRFLFGACLFVLIASSFLFYSIQTEKLLYQQNRIMGQLLADQVLLAKHWTVFEPPETQPLVEELTKRLGQQKYDCRFLMLRGPGDANGPVDEFEAAVLRYFSEPRPKDTPDESKYRERFVDDYRKYQYYQPVYAQESCTLACHRAEPSGADFLGSTPATPMGAVPVPETNLIAIVKVTIPNAPTQVALNTNRAILLSTAIITVFLAMVASYVIVRYVIVKPLRHLRDVSDAISRGNTSLRAEIHTGDEYDELAVAFNRMLRHMLTAQEELRQVNANLDMKVDELAQANMRLYELNMLKSDFLATMSHELRTPLNSILGFSEVLGSIESLDVKQKRYVQHIQKSGKTLLEMINDILDLAKIESGRMETRPTDFRIAQVIAAQCDMARPLTERKNIDLEMDVEPDLPPMHQDQARVQQILNNLLSNAIKFTPEGGRITVAAHRDASNFLALEVTDTGVGIAEEDQQAIFEKFRQGKTAIPGGDAMTREYSGSGLGLSIVKELCRLLGGSVSLESELGKGSTFTIRLPWVLEEQPRLDAAIVAGFDEFTKPRFEVAKE